MRRFAFFVVLLSLIGAAPAAGEDMTVVELFTAQGCDKCPPADVLLEDLSGKRGVLALAWHVDYWDFMGWKDSMARPEHKDRQQAYNESMGGTGVLTPQFVVNGREQITGPKKQALYQTVSDAAETDVFPVRVRFEYFQDDLSVTLRGRMEAQPATVLLVWYRSFQKMDIKGGANSGKKMDYVNIVQSSREAGLFDGETVSFPIDLNDDDRNGADCLAVLVQETTVGPVIGAERICF